MPIHSRPKPPDGREATAQTAVPGDDEGRVQAAIPTAAGDRRGATGDPGRVAGAAAGRLFPLVAFDLVDHGAADAALTAWGHWLGPCRRPFGRQSFALSVEGLGLVSVAVSASTVNPTCGGWPRGQVVELARLCSHPDHRWATRVCLRLWREVAPRCWAARYWPVRACVSYANAARHSGATYRLDGWRRVADVPGGTAGGDWTRGKTYEPKTVWAWELPTTAPPTALTARAAPAADGAGPTLAVPAAIDPAGGAR